METKHTRKPNKAKTQPLTPEAMLFIASLAAKEDSDLSFRCRRHLRRATDWRHAVATVLFATVCLFYFSLIGHPQYDQVTTTGTASGRQICQSIQSVLEQTVA